MLKVLVPISNGTEEMEAVIIIDMLRRAGTIRTLCAQASAHTGTSYARCGGP